MVTGWVIIKGSRKSRKMLELFMKNCILISNYTDDSTRRKQLSSTICWLKLKEQLLAVAVFSVSYVSVNQVENLSFNKFCARNLLWTLITSMNVFWLPWCYSSGASWWRHKYHLPGQYLVMHYNCAIYKVLTIVAGTGRSSTWRTDLKPKISKSPS